MTDNQEDKAGRTATMRDLYEIAAEVKESGPAPPLCKEEDYGLPQRNRHERRKMKKVRRSGR